MSEGSPAAHNVVWHHATVTRARLEAQNGHRGAIITPASHPLDHQITAILRAALPDLQAIYRYGSAGSVPAAG